MVHLLVSYGYCRAITSVGDELSPIKKWSPGSKKHRFGLYLERFFIVLRAFFAFYGKSADKFAKICFCPDLQKRCHAQKKQKSPTTVCATNPKKAARLSRGLAELATPWAASSAAYTNPETTVLSNASWVLLCLSALIAARPKRTPRQQLLQPQRPKPRLKTFPKQLKKAAMPLFCCLMQSCIQLNCVRPRKLSRHHAITPYERRHSV